MEYEGGEGTKKSVRERAFETTLKPGVGNCYMARWVQLGRRIHRVSKAMAGMAKTGQAGEGEGLAKADDHN